MRVEGPEVGVRFVMPGVDAEASPVSRVDTENLAKDVTVRVLAFKRRTGGASADITADTYVTEATYKALADGTLVPCNVFGATGDIDSVSTATPAEIRLRADTYDFYALTPAIAISAPWEVSISHGVDHAASVKEAVAVGPAYVNATTHKQPVQLTPLDRKCVKISFSFDRKAASSSIKKILVDKVELSQIAHAPSAASKLCTPLAIGANDGSHLFPTGKVVYNDTATPPTVDRYDCFDEVLPKASGEYKLSLNVYFNPLTDDPANETPAKQPTKLEATLSATNPTGNTVLAFVPGYHYNFKISLKGNIFTLYIQVGDWDLAPDWGNSDLGGWPGASIVVGQWDLGPDWSTELGGAMLPTISVGEWTANPSENWGSDVGGFPTLSGLTIGGTWGSGSDTSFEMGNN